MIGIAVVIIILMVASYILGAYNGIPNWDFTNKKTMYDRVQFLSVIKEGDTLIVIRPYPYNPDTKEYKVKANSPKLQTIKLGGSFDSPRVLKYKSGYLKNIIDDNMIDYAHRFNK